MIVRGEKMFCKDAKRWLKIEVICGKDCPIVKKCPRLIMEDANDKAIEQAMLAMKEVIDAG